MAETNRMVTRQFYHWWLEREGTPIAAGKDETVVSENGMWFCGSGYRAAEQAIRELGGAKVGDTFHAKLFSNDD